MPRGAGSHFCAASCRPSPRKRSKSWGRWNIVGPYVSYGLFQTTEETCAKFGSDRFRNVDLYKVQTYKQTNKHSSLYIRLLGRQNLAHLRTSVASHTKWPLEVVRMSFTSDMTLVKVRSTLLGSSLELTSLEYGCTAVKFERIRSLLSSLDTVQSLFGIL